MDKPVDNSSPVMAESGQATGDMTMRKRKLTPKQEAFALEVAGGETLSGAYRKAYSADNMAAGSIHREASVLMSNPMVSQRVAALQEERARVVNASEVSDRERVLRKLRALMDSAGAETVQLNAAIALGKSVALFTDVVENRDKPRTVAEIERELDQLLADHGPDLSQTCH